MISSADVQRLGVGDDVSVGHVSVRRFVHRPLLFSDRLDIDPGLP
ncbi:hypothetical protein CZ774_12540 [Frigoribacterium sp. JB110]|nr:hypothetical protein CZ774_12540 [Frigoribacterium sp. JB110]